MSKITVDVTPAANPQAQTVPQTTTVIVKERDSASERRETIRILAWVFLGSALYSHIYGMLEFTL
jgi:hypothetical protein